MGLSELRLALPESINTEAGPAARGSPGVPARLGDAQGHSPVSRAPLHPSVLLSSLELSETKVGISLFHTHTLSLTHSLSLSFQEAAVEFEGELSSLELSDPWEFERASSLSRRRLRSAKANLLLARWAGVKVANESNKHGVAANPGTNSHGARPVHLIITMIKWIRTSRLSRKNSRRRTCSWRDGRGPRSPASRADTASLPTLVQGYLAHKKQHPPLGPP